MGGDDDLLLRLRAGDEAAFMEVVDRYHTSMVRLATGYVPNAAVAEEVVQDTWLGVLRGIDRFEGRSSLKTWLFRILMNRARTTGARERRVVPLADDATVDAARFSAGGQWASPPVPWEDDVDERLAAADTVARIRSAIDDLPDGQRQVLLLRDVENLTSTEVCDILQITDGNQRVLLHRGRAAIRQSLAATMGKD